MFVVPQHKNNKTENLKKVIGRTNERDDVVDNATLHSHKHLHTGEK